MLEISHHYLEVIQLHGLIHMWSVPADLKSRDPAKYDAVMKLNKFMWDNSINWSRTGHMSYRASVIASRCIQKSSSP